MGKLILFPRRQSNKVTVLQKREARRLALSLSVLSVLVLAVTLNERLHEDGRPQYIVAGSKIEQLNRAIASAHPADMVESIRAEHELVDKINQIERVPASIGINPSKNDQFRYGSLEGKYRINESASKISEVEYVDSVDITDRPVLVRDSQQFLMENRDLFMVPFAKAEIDKKSAKGEIFRLFDSQGLAVGRASFEFDSSGHLLSLKVQDSGLESQ